MKFTLTYDGDLQSNGDRRRKWAIRKTFHPQLQELWRLEPALRHAIRNRFVPPTGAFMIWEEHHSSVNSPPDQHPPDHSYIDLCATIDKAGRKFLPLVRNSFGLTCGLKVQYLRKEPPGRVYQGGDLDNRLKTLFDALQIPDAQQVVDDDDPSIADGPIYCLLEDDALITSCAVETHRLLSRPNASVHEVHLLVEVDVRVSQPRAYNYAFLGD